jgi:hypothetical protein
LGVFREAMNQYGQTLVFTNTSTTACTMFGRPVVQLVGGDRRVIDSPVRHGGGYTFVDHGANVVTLAPASTASFAFGGPAWDLVGDRPCLEVIAVRVIPPNDYTQLTVAVHAVACPEGITVSAVGPGRDSTIP